MRILADMRSYFSPVPGEPFPSIVQVQEDGGVIGNINGKFVVCLPVGVDVNEESYLLNSGGQIDGGSVLTKSYQKLLLQYPQFDAVYYNPLILPEHIDEMDASFLVTLGAVKHSPRYQAGRFVAPLDPDNGNLPGHVALLPNAPNPPQPGLIVTKDIDLTGMKQDCNGNNLGAKVFIVRWTLHEAHTSHDVADRSSQENIPAIRSLGEVEPEEVDVYISGDGGGTWERVFFMVPKTLCEETMNIRLAFINKTSRKVFLSSYAMIF